MIFNFYLNIGSHVIEYIISSLCVSHFHAYFKIIQLICLRKITKLPNDLTIIEKIEGEREREGVIFFLIYFPRERNERVCKCY